MLKKLPGWVVSNHESVEREAVHYRGMTVDQRLELLASLCKMVPPLLEMNALRDRVLALRDPLPESSRRALARLRQQARNAKVQRG
jgi:hypothetical protein